MGVNNGQENSERGKEKLFSCHNTLKTSELRAITPGTSKGSTGESCVINMTTVLPSSYS